MWVVWGAADLVAEESPPTPDDGPHGPNVFSRQGGGRSTDVETLSPRLSTRTRSTPCDKAPRLII